MELAPTCPRLPLALNFLQADTMIPIVQAQKLNTEKLKDRAKIATDRQTQGKKAIG